MADRGDTPCVPVSLPLRQNARSLGYAESSQEVFPIDSPSSPCIYGTVFGTEKQAKFIGDYLSLSDNFTVVQREIEQ